MALIDNVSLAKVKAEGAYSTTSLGGVDIDWDLVFAPAIKAAMQALRREVWEWLDGNQKAVIFKVKVKVWIVPINWKVTAKDAEDFVTFLLGPRPA